DGGGQGGRRGGAGGARLGELELDVGGLAREGGVEQRIKRERGGVGRHRDHVVELDAVTAAGIERELRDLAARGQPIAAEGRQEGCARLGRNGEAILAQLGLDQPVERLLVVLVAGQRRRILGALAQRAQRRVAAQVAGLDHDAAVRRGGGEQRLDRR